MHRETKTIFIALALAFALGAWPAAHSQSKGAPRQQTDASVTFDFHGNASQVPAKFVGGLVFLPASVGGSQPSFFVLNTTAAASSISPDRARELGLVGEKTGVSGGRAETEILRTPILNFPGLKMSFSRLLVASGDNFAEDVGEPYQGSLGNDVLSEVEMEIDYQREFVQIFDRGVVISTLDAAVLPLTFSGKMPVVRAKFTLAGRKGGEADFVINTAIDAAIVFSEPYAEANHIFSSHVKTIQASIPELDGGKNVAIGRLKGFQLGPYVVEQPIAVFSRSKVTPDSGKNIAGWIGAGLLRRFTVLFDYPRQKLVLKPNSQFGNEEEEDKSGLAIIATGAALKTFEVVAVQPNTPAAQAGIQKGDIIEGVDDEAAADLTLAAIHNLFRQIGHKYKLTLNRHGQSVQVTIQMKRLL